MIKYYCDRCKKEIKEGKIHRVECVYVYELCEDCYDYLLKLLEKEIDDYKE